MMIISVIVLGITLTVLPDNVIPRVFHGKWIEIPEGTPDIENPKCAEGTENVSIDPHTYKDSEFECTFQKVIISEGHTDGVLVNVEQQCKTKDGKDVGLRLNIYNVISGQPGNILILVPPNGGFRYYRHCVG